MSHFPPIVHAAGDRVLENWQMKAALLLSRPRPEFSEIDTHIDHVEMHIGQHPDIRAEELSELRRHLATLLVHREELSRTANGEPPLVASDAAAPSWEAVAERLLAESLDGTAPQEHQAKILAVTAHLHDLPNHDVPSRVFTNLRNYLHELYLTEAAEGPIAGRIAPDVSTGVYHGRQPYGSSLCGMYALNSVLYSRNLALLEESEFKAEVANLNAIRCASYLDDPFPSGGVNTAFGQDEATESTTSEDLKHLAQMHGIESVTAYPQTIVDLPQTVLNQTTALLIARAGHWVALIKHNDMWHETDSMQPRDDSRIFAGHTLEAYFEATIGRAEPGTIMLF